MFRTVLWAIVALYLLIVGLVPAAVAPVMLTFAGLAAVIETVPGVVWVAVGVIAWLKNRPAPAQGATA